MVRNLFMCNRAMRWGWNGVAGCGLYVKDFGDVDFLGGNWIVGVLFVGVGRVGKPMMMMMICADSVFLCMLKP